MADGEKHGNSQDEDDGEFKRSILSLLKDAAYAVAVLLVLTGVEMLVSYLPLNKSIKAYVSTLHEWSSIAIFTIFVLKSVVRVALKSWRQMWKSVREED